MDVARLTPAAQLAQHHGHFPTSPSPRTADGRVRGTCARALDTTCVVLASARPAPMPAVALGRVGAGAGCAVEEGQQFVVAVRDPQVREVFHHSLGCLEQEAGVGGGDHVDVVV